MSGFDLTTLQLLVAVIDETSIAKAARKKHITAAAISKRISELEQRVGVPLLERHCGTTRPTPAGIALVDTARKVLGDLDALRATLSEFVEGVRGEVRLFSGTSGIVGSMPDDLREFVLTYPGIALTISEHHSDEVIRGVREKLADIGIYSPQVAAGHLDVYPYQPVRLVLLCSQRHALAGRKSVWFAEAANYDFIGLTPESALGLLLSNVARHEHLVLRRRFEVAGHEAVRRLVRSNIGIGILPEVSVQPYAEALGIRSIRLRDSWSQYRLMLCTRPLGTLSLPVRKVLGHLLARGPG